MSMASEFYNNKIGFFVEKAIVQATVPYKQKVKIYVPALMADVSPSSQTTDPEKSSQSNVINKSTKISKKVTSTTGGYYEVLVPEWIASAIRNDSRIMKGQVLYIGFIGGDLNSPIVIGAE